MKLENKFHCNKKSHFLKNVDIDNILISNKISSRKKNYKYIIDNIDNDYKIKPFSFVLPKNEYIYKKLWW